MLNAVQGVDMLMGGLDSALATLRDRSEARAEQSAFDHLAAQHDLLVARFNALLEDATRLEKRLEAKNQAYADLQAQMVAVNTQSIDATAARSMQINRLEARLKRESANAHSMTAIRDLLLAEVLAFGDPARFSSMAPEKRSEVMETAWRECMAEPKQ